MLRLASAKANAVSRENPDALVIGSDQLASCRGEAFGKPGSREKAFEQLQAIRGQQLDFHTGLCLLNSRTEARQLDCVSYSIEFRDYSNDEIERYLDREQPYNCAAAFKSEALGISLVSSMSGPDPTALIGLPLISLCRMLRQEGLVLP